MRQPHQSLLRFLVLSAFGPLATGITAAAPVVNLSGVQYVTYGDGQSYSLPYAVNDKCGGTNAGCPYYIKAGPGQIDDYVVLATGTNNSGTTTNFAGMDNAYITPNGSGVTFAQASAANSRGSQGSITNNRADTWDASLTSMKSFLGTGQAVFFFNNNQTGSNQAATESLAAWAQIWITKGSGVDEEIVGDVFKLTNRNGKYGLFTEGGGGVFEGSVGDYTSSGLGGPIAGDNTNTDYVLSGGRICRTSAGVPVSCSSASAVESEDHNLGTNETAYAILFPELTAQLNALFDDPLLNLDEYTLHVDYRLGCDPSITGANVAAICESSPFGRSMNNGYEQIFMGVAEQQARCSPTDPTCTPTLPEPSTIALMGAALLGLGISRRRRTLEH